MLLPASLAGLLGASLAATAESSEAMEGRGWSPMETVTGNWTSITCDAFWDVSLWPPKDRWGFLNCKNAWDDVISEWKKFYRPIQDKGQRFSAAVLSRFGGYGGDECGSVYFSDCRDNVACSDHPGGVLPAGAEIINSLARVHYVFASYFEGIDPQYPGRLNDGVLETYRTFATDLKYKSDLFQAPPISSDTLGVVALASAATSFNASLYGQPYYTHQPSDLRAAFTTFATALAAGASMRSGQTVVGLLDAVNMWKNITQTGAQQLFLGSDEAIDYLTLLLSDGRMAWGIKKRETPEFRNLQNAVGESSINSKRAFDAAVIPAMWAHAGTGAFVLPAEREGCEDPTGTRPDGVDKATAEATWSCFEGRLYYLVKPKGSGKFEAPRGLDKVNQNAKFQDPFGNLSRDDLVAGAVRTFQSNGNRNGGKPDFSKDSKLVTELYDRGVDSPGLVRIPVCGAAEASKNGKEKERYDVYPCDAVEGSVPAVPVNGASGLRGGWRQVLGAGMLMVSLLLW